jgi:hypothetical protein
MWLITDPTAKGKKVLFRIVSTDPETNDLIYEYFLNWIAQFDDLYQIKRKPDLIHPQQTITLVTVSKHKQKND